jgi:DNA-binding Xre family transcriptional regulator
MSDIYKNIDKCRMLKGIPKKDFLDQIEMTGVGYTAMEKNKSIKLNTLMLIAQKLNVSLTDLLENEIKLSYDYVLENNEHSTKPAVSYFINPVLLEQESISRIVNLPINDAEKVILLSERISLMQSHLKIILDSSGEQEKQLERLQRQIDILIQ